MRISNNTSVKGPRLRWLGLLLAGSLLCASLPGARAQRKIGGAFIDAEAEAPGRGGGGGGGGTGEAGGAGSELADGGGGIGGLPRLKALLGLLRKGYVRSDKKDTEEGRDVDPQPREEDLDGEEGPGDDGGRTPDGGGAGGQVERVDDESKNHDSETSDKDAHTLLRAGKDGLLHDGEACKFASQCNDEHCTCNRCGKYDYPDGSRCTSDENCVSGYCAGGVGDCDGRCQQKLLNGAMCTSDSDCVSETCVCGTCGKAAVGGNCKLSTDCAGTNMECRGVEADSCGICRLKDGESCSEWHNCLSGMCNCGICGKAGGACQTTENCANGHSCVGDNGGLCGGTCEK